MQCNVDAVIIGAGPAGCAAACVLADAGLTVTVIDKHETAGGLARTIKRNGNLFDIGPHRFFTKSPEVLDVWHRHLGKDLIQVDRLTRILYRGKLFNYPLSPLNALLGLGIGTSVHAMFSFGYLKLKRSFNPREPKSFEDWVSDNFGRVLYEAFFKHYTEKVWGIPCREISATWASQRIKGLDLFRAALNALSKHRTSKIKTLLDRFLYPRNGSGMLYTNMIHHVERMKGTYINNATVRRLIQDKGGWDVEFTDAQGKDESLTCRHVLSSAPISDLVDMISPAPPEDVQKTSASLGWRNHYGVNFVIKNPQNIFPDNWIYVHSPDVQIARIANYANFSKDMQEGPQHYPVTAEFFSSPGDKMSSLDDAGRIDFAIRELKSVGLLNAGHVVGDPIVVFSRAAYPLLERGYSEKVAKIKRYLAGLEGLQTMGRAGMFQYNNQDHSIMTGLLAARNVLGGAFDLWGVNIDAEYLESGTAPDLCERDREGSLAP